jgi:hypothetical protein
MEWQPIETAPKDGTRVLLHRPSAAASWAQLVIGSFCLDQHAKRPRPYWKHDKERLEGVRQTRGEQPTHWMPLPSPPEQNGDET